MPKKEREPNTDAHPRLELAQKITEMVKYQGEIMPEDLGGSITPHPFALEDLRAHCMRMNIKILPSGLVSTKHAARFLGVSEKTLANQRSRGGIGVIPFFKRFNRVWYHISDLSNVYRRSYTSTAQARVGRYDGGER